MTWAFSVARGGGPIEYRLVIAGYSRQWCTDGMLLGSTSDGRKRCHGLQREGLRISERARLAEGLPEQTAFTASIVDVDGEATAEFTAEPTVRVWLTDTAGPAATDFELTSVADIVDGERYYVGTETVRASGAPSGNVQGVVRGDWQTIAQGHWAQRGQTPLSPELTDVPVMMTGRRAFLYAHGPGQTATSNAGTLVFRGVVAGEPQERDGMWAIRIDPIMSVIDQDIVQALPNSLTPIGIYYPWSAPLVIDLGEGAGPLSYFDVMSRVIMSGYWASQEAFVQDLSDALVSAMSGFDSKVFAGIESGRWELYCQASANGYPLIAWCSNPVDGTTTQRWDLAEGDGAGWSPNPGWLQPSALHRMRWERYDAGAMYPSPISSKASTDGPGRMRSFPRLNTYAFSSRDINEGDFTDPDTATAPHDRLYVQEAYLLEVGDVVEIITDEGENAPPHTQRFEILTVDPDSGMIELQLDRPIYAAWVGGEGPQLRVARNAVAEPMSLAGFRDSLVADGPERGNLGDVPLVTAADLADWTAPVNVAANGRAPLLRRVYSFPRRSSLREVLSQELRAYGLFAFTDSNGAISVRPLQPALETDATAFTITADHRDVDDGFGVVDVAADGIINVAEMRADYDAQNGRHVGDTFIFPNAISISRLAGRKRTLEIRPLVGLEAGVSWSRQDAHQVATVPISYFGERYHILSLPVTLHAFALRVGDVVSVSVPQLPWRGRRGVQAIGTVIGYEWDFQAGHGSLEILLRDSQGVAGYAPSARIVAQSNTTGNTWVLTLQASRYAPAGAADVSVFDRVGAGARVRVVIFDGDTPSPLAGTVVSVNAPLNQITVTFTGAWTPSTSTWDLVFDTHAAAVATGIAAQLAHAFVADDERLLSDGSPARSFSP